MFQLSQEEQGGGGTGGGGLQGGTGWNRMEQRHVHYCTLYIHTGIGYISTWYRGICTVHSVLGRWLDIQGGAVEQRHVLIHCGTIHSYGYIGYISIGYMYGYTE